MIYLLHLQLFKQKLLIFFALSVCLVILISFLSTPSMCFLKLATKCLSEQQQSPFLVPKQLALQHSLSLLFSALHFGNVLVLNFLKISTFLAPISFHIASFSFSSLLHYRRQMMVLRQSWLGQTKKCSLLASANSTYTLSANRASFCFFTATSLPILAPQL